MAVAVVLVEPRVLLQVELAPRGEYESGLVGASDG